MTRLPDTPEPVLATVRGTLLLLLIAVVAALLLVVGLPREADLPAPSSRVAAAAVHAAMSKIVVSEPGAVRAPLHAVAPNVAEADDGVGRPALADAPSYRLARLSAETGFRPREPVLVRAWASAPPDRPPRHA